MALEYVEKGSKKLRMGYTTGSCAALVAKASAQTESDLYKSVEVACNE